MVQKIPLSKDFQITPNVVSPAGTALEANGLVLTDNSLIPAGDIMEVYSAKDIGDLLGIESKEYRAAVTYFNGYRDSTVKPAKLLLSNSCTRETSAFLLSGAMRGTKPTDFSDLAGALTITVGGEVLTGRELQLTTATSYSDIAAAIAASFLPAATSVTFNPPDINIALGEDSGQTQYTVVPEEAVGDVIFEIPEANKNNVDINTNSRSITVKRSTTPTYNIIAKSAASGDEIGTLKVTIAQETLANAVTFNPTALEIAEGENTGSATYAIDPTNANEEIIFSVPEANKNDIKVDTSTKTITLTRNADALSFSVTAKGATSDKMLGELKVTFKTAAEQGSAKRKQNVNYIEVARHALVASEGKKIEIRLAANETTPIICEWLVTSQRFYITIPSVGDISTISFVTSDDGNITAKALKLTADTSAQKSNGTSVKTGEEVMNAITDGNQNFILFTTLVDLDDAQKESFCRFASNSNARFGYVYTDASQAAVISNNPECFQQKVVVANNYESIFPMYGNLQYSMLPLAYCASLNFNAANGRVSFKFRRFTSVAANVDRLSDAMALDSNGYNYYGAYGLNATLADYSSQGKITGKYIWLDSFIDEVWINANLVSSFLALFLANQSYPFNVRGYATVETAVSSVASRGLAYGAIQTGVTLDPEQLAIVNGETGLDLQSVLFNQGWYFYIPPQRGETRIERILAGAIFYWVDGQLIQSIRMASTTIL